MMIDTSIAGGPLLRVVTPQPEKPRHLAMWGHGGENFDDCTIWQILEVWTTTEWDAMTAAERPEHAQQVAGVGWVRICQTGDRDMALRLADQRWHAIEEEDRQRDRAKRRRRRAAGEPQRLTGRGRRAGRSKS
jgi:hypothetical protein